MRLGDRHGLPPARLTILHISASTTAAWQFNGGGAGYHWKQAAGPFVVLEDRETATPTFLAPEVDEPTELIFALRVDDGTLLSPPAPVSVTVRSGGGCSAAPRRPGSAEILLAATVAIVILQTRRRKRASKV